MQAVSRGEEEEEEEKKEEKEEESLKEEWSWLEFIHNTNHKVSFVF